GANARALLGIRAHARARRRVAARGAAAVLTLAALQEQIRSAAARKAPLRLRGGGSKDFYGNTPRGELLDTRAYAGIAAYEPSELVITARCGTALAEIEHTLEGSGQCLRLEMDEARALDAMNQWAGEPLPLSATAWHNGVLHVRLSGSDVAVRGAARRLGGAQVDYAWDAIREQTHPFFAGDGTLWRLAVPSTTPPLALDGRQLIEWGGALRWIRGDAPQIRGAAQRAGGHATLFRG